MAGDIVHPDGLDFAAHQRDPWVDLEHNGQCVGWARKSLSKPGGRYGVERLTLDVDGSRHRLPVGTTWFDPNDALQSQVFALVAEDALPGVSLEFAPVPRQFKAIGTSPIERRPSYEFFRGDVVRWTHCAAPVNEGATVAKSINSVGNDRLASILSANRVGSEQLHPTIRKALTDHYPERRLFRVEKAMDEQTPAATDTVYDDATPEPDGDEGGSPTAMAAYSLAQGIKDLCEQVRESLSKGEHVKGRKTVNKILDGIESYVEDALAAGKMVEADLSDDDGDEADEPAEPEVSEEDMEPDEDGVMKCLLPVKKALKRFQLKTIEKAREAESAGADAAVEREARRLRRSLGRLA